MTPKWAIRLPMANDLHFIYSTWLNSYYVDSAIGKSVRKSIFYREYTKVIDSLLDRARVKVACQPDDPSVIYGYLVYETSPIKALHYCFVKQAFWKEGIARALVDNALGFQFALNFTHRTERLEPILEKYPLLTYNPFILFKGMGDEWETE